MDKEQFINIINELEFNKITSFVIYYNNYNEEDAKENKIEFNF